MTHKNIEEARNKLNKIYLRLAYGKGDIEKTKQEVDAVLAQIIADTERERFDDYALQQFTGMHYSNGTDVQAVCIGMGLEQAEWDRIKPECEWLDEWEIRKIEDYLKSETPPPQDIVSKDK